MHRGVFAVVKVSIVTAAALFVTAGEVGSSVFAALPPAEQLVPASTKLFVACRNVREFEEAARTTNFGKLVDDPLMQAFRDDLKNQIEQTLSSSEVQFGIRFEDVHGVCSGQAAVAVAPLAVAEGAAPRTAVMLVLDVTGNVPQVQQLQQKIAADLAKRNAQAQPLQTPGGAVGTQYVVPPQQAGDIQRELVDVVQTVGADTLWILSDGASLPIFASGELTAPTGTTLAKNDTFVKVMQETNPAAGEPASHIALFVEPLGLAEALRAYENPPQRHKPDALAVFRKVGFDAIQGLGGQLTAAVGDYGALARVRIVAPKPWRESMNMLTFVPGADFAPQGWIGDEVAAYAVLYWDVVTAFDHFGPIFDGFLEDEGIWADVIDSFETDPDGPQIKLRDNFFAQAANRVTGIVDRSMAGPGQGAQYLLAFDLKPKDPNANPPITPTEKVAELLRKAFANDPTVNKSKLGELDVYELTATEDVPANAPGAGAAGGGAVVNGQRKIVSALVTAADGYFYIASELDILKKALDKTPRPKPLANAADYVAVAGELKNFLPAAQPQLVGLGFARTGEMAHDDYELFRAGKLRGSETALGKLLMLIDQNKEPVEGRQELKLNGALLPPFAQVEKYFSPLGLMIRESGDGWLIVALTHEKAPLVGVAANAGQPAAAAPAPAANP